MENLHLLQAQHLVLLIICMKRLTNSNLNTYIFLTESLRNWKLTTEITLVNKRYTNKKFKAKRKKNL